MGIRFRKNPVTTFALTILIFVGAVTLVSLILIVGSGNDPSSIISEAYNYSGNGGDTLSGGNLTLPINTFLGIVLVFGFLGTAQICWTIYLFQKSRGAKETSRNDPDTEPLDKVNSEPGPNGRQLTTLIEGSTDLISAIDKEHRITCFNSAYGRDTKNLFDVDIGIGTNVLEILSLFPEAQSKSKRLWDRALSGERFIASEEFVDDQKQEHFYEVTYNPLRDESGEIVGASHIARNVTERKLAQESLKRERNFVSTIVEASNLLVMVTDLDGRIERFNRSCEIASGYKFEELEGRVFWNILIPPDEAPEIKLAHGNLRDESFVQNYVSHWITKDERSRLISWRSAKIKDDDGGKFLVATGIDVTEKEEFKETQNRVLDILETSSDFIGISDMKGKMNYLNPAGKEILDIGKSEDISSLDMIDAYPKWAAKLIQKEGVPLAIRGGSWIGETALKTPGGREIPVSQLILAHENERGEPEFFSTVARDISAQKRLEKELSTTRDAALETAKLKSEFLVNMSHEIRTPLNGIIGLAELLLSTDLDKEQTDYAKSALSSGDVLLTIVNDILDFSKIEVGSFHMEIVSFELRKTVESVLEIFAESAQHKGVEIALSVEEDVPDNLFGDPRRLKRVLTNLIANSLKFTEHGEVIIRVKLNENEQNPGIANLQFNIADTGTGIPDEARDSLFDTLPRMDSSNTQRSARTSVGLVISKQLVRMMNGEIGVKSTVDNGATFWFTAGFETDNSDPYSIPYSNELKDRRVLIIDDNDAIRNVLLQQAKWVGMTVEEAGSGEVALEMLKQAAENGEPFEVVVIDLNMPEIDGISLSYEIRKLPILSKTRILLMPAINDHNLVKKAKVVGVDSYQFKPIRQSEFYHHLHNLLTESEVALKRRADELLLEIANKTEEPGFSEDQIELTIEGTGPRILIAEDNFVNQKVISNQIKRLGYSADIKGNGIDVLDALKTNDYALIIMDCQMPIMDGLQATTEIRRAEGSGRHIPIVALTALAIEGDRERCIAAGMDDYVTKPTKQHELAEAIKRWIPRGSSFGSRNSSDSPENNAQPEEEHIDERLNELSETCGEEVVLECIDLFLNEIETSVERLKRRIKRSNMTNLDKVDKEAHSLKGSSANMGAFRLPGLCEELMAAVHSVDEDEIRRLFDSIQGEHLVLKTIYEAQRKNFANIVKELQPIS